MLASLMGKGRKNHEIIKLNRGVDHIRLFGLDKESDSTKDSLRVTLGNDLDFETESFGRIVVSTLGWTSRDPRFIQRFFDALEQADEVIITVEDVDNPDLHEKSVIKLSSGNNSRWMYTRLFWAVLPRIKKDPYRSKYSSHYDRLIHILLDLKKEIVFEEM